MPGIGLYKSHEGDVHPYDHRTQKPRAGYDPGRPVPTVAAVLAAAFLLKYAAAGLQPDRHRFGGASAWLRRSGGDRRYCRTVRADHELCLRHEQWSGIDGQPLLWGRGAGGHPPRRRLDGHPFGGGVDSADNSVAAGTRCAAAGAAGPCRGVGRRSCLPDRYSAGHPADNAVQYGGRPAARCGQQCYTAFVSFVQQCAECRAGRRLYGAAGHGRARCRCSHGAGAGHQRRAGRSVSGPQLSGAALHPRAFQKSLPAVRS